MALLRQAAAVLTLAKALDIELSKHNGTYHQSRSGCQQLVQALQHEFEIDSIGHRTEAAAKGGMRGVFKAARFFTSSQLARQVRYQKRQREKEKKLRLQENPRRLEQNRVANLWYVRTMLADAHVSQHMLSDLCTEFALSEVMSWAI
jgi:hypothetical protein